MPGLWEQEIEPRTSWMLGKLSNELHSQVWETRLLKIIFLSTVCVHVWIHMYYGAQLSGADSLLPLWGLGIEFSLPSTHTHSKHFYPLRHRVSPDWTLWELKSTTISTQPATRAKELLQLCPPLSPHPVSCVSLAEWLLLKQGPIQSEVQWIWFIFWNYEHVIYNWNVLNGKKEYLGLLQHEEGLFLPVGCRNRQPCFPFVLNLVATGLLLVLTWGMLWGESLGRSIQWLHQFVFWRTHGWVGSRTVFILNSSNKRQISQNNWLPFTEASSQGKLRVTQRETTVV